MFRIIKRLPEIVGANKMSNRSSSATWHPIRSFASTNSEELIPADLQDWQASLDETTVKKLRYIQNEMRLASIEEGFAIDPDTVSIVHYQRLLIQSTNQRKSYYSYLNGVIRVMGNAKIKRNIKFELLPGRCVADRPPNPSNHIEYGLWHNSLYVKIEDDKVKKMKNANVRRNMELDQQRLVFDCSFDNAMTSREIQETAQQLSRVYSRNRDHLEPYVLHLCNLNRSGPLWDNMTKWFIGFQKLPIYLDERPYWDIFPKEKITVLTQSSPNVLKEYDPEAYYVFGALVDLTPKKRLILSKAKEMNIQTARIPFDLYGSFRRTDCLPLSILTQIMLEMKTTRSWSDAFKLMPARCVL